MRSLIGTAMVDVDSFANVGLVMADIRTTTESGPIRFSKDESLAGDIRLVISEFFEGTP